MALYRKVNVCSTENFKPTGMDIIVGNCLRSFSVLEAESVQCIVTSPPYWGLRKYEGEQDFVWGDNDFCEHDWNDAELSIAGGGFSDKSTLAGFTSANVKGRELTKDTSATCGTCALCGAWRGAFGLEPSLKMYVDHTIEILRECWRVLKKDGVLFWNVDDSYAGGGNYRGLNSENTLTTKQAPNKGATGVHQELGALGKDTGSAKPKDLCLIPDRIRIRAQEEGWWVRSNIIWQKTNPMPESVTDRPTSSYEDIIMLTKSSTYFWDKDAVSEVASNAGKVVSLGEKSFSKGQADGNLVERSGNALEDTYVVPETRNMRNVWTFPTQPYKHSHVAAFPEELPRRCIKAATKEGDTVLDPFCGSGTSGFVAFQLNRNFIGLEISDEYAKLARNRIAEISESPLFEMFA